MKKQQGFTLIELMVVMAIIAILATAGLSAYGGYLKKARDATRLEDIRALESVAVSTFSASGQSVSLTNYKAAVSAMNNGTILIDPMDNKAVCLNTAGTASTALCGYYYAQCDNGGYILRVKFESLSNHPLYTQDKLNTDSGAGLNSSYDVGNCDNITPGEEGYIR